jgi:hypothetical protein
MLEFALMHVVEAQKFGVIAGVDVVANGAAGKQMQIKNRISNSVTEGIIVSGCGQCISQRPKDEKCDRDCLSCFTGNSTAAGE